MGRSVPAAEPGSHRRAAASAGRGARGGAQPVRGGAVPRREQAQDVLAARRAHPAGLHVHHAAEIRDVVPAGEMALSLYDVSYCGRAVPAAEPD